MVGGGGGGGLAPSQIIGWASPPPSYAYEAPEQQNNGHQTKAEYLLKEVLIEKKN